MPSPDQKLKKSPFGLAPEFSISEKGRFTFSCHALIITTDPEGNKYCLLVKEAGDDGYNLPGGRPKKGEGVTEAVIREIWEETGLKATKNNLKLAGYFSLAGITRSPAYLYEISNAAALRLCDQSNNPADAIEKYWWLNTKDAASMFRATYPSTEKLAELFENL